MKEDSLIIEVNKKWICYTYIKNINYSSYTHYDKAILSYRDIGGKGMYIYKIKTKRKKEKYENVWR